MSCALTKGPTKTVGPTLRPPISSSCSRVVLCPLRSSVGLFVSILKLLGAGHHAANVVDTASVVSSDGVGVSMVVGVGGVGDGGGGDGHGGNDGLLVNVGNGNVAGGVVNVGDSGGGLVSIRDRAGEGQGNGGQEN